MRFLYLALFSFFAVQGFSQSTPIVSKVTADWCPNCGTWGWDFMESMKEEFQSGPAIVLGVHYSGGLMNETSEWWKSNLNSSSQPRFYLNNELISVSRSNWEDKVTTTVEDAQAVADAGATARFNHKRIALENNELEVIVNMEALPLTGNEVYVANYVFEDRIDAYQSARSDALHPNVLRAHMGTAEEGQLATAIGEFSFSMTIDDTWVEDNLGLLTVIWEKEGDDFKIIASEAVPMISALTSDTQDLLDNNDFTFADRDGAFVVSTTTIDKYQLRMTDMSGQLVVNTSFSNEIILDKTTLPSGIYVAILRSENGVLSKQLFVK